MSEGEYYNIEKILDRRKIGGKFEYKIKWEGYPMSQSTWEPMKNLETAKELVEEYNRTHPIKNVQKTSDSFINKKRKEEIEEKSQQISQNEKGPEDEVKIDNVISKINNNENENENVNVKVNEKTYIIDDSLRSVFTVKQQNQRLMAVVEKLNDDGNIERIYIPTEELRRTNPWILLNFYESKIKFT